MSSVKLAALLVALGCVVASAAIAVPIENLDSKLLYNDALVDSIFTEFVKLNQKPYQDSHEEYQLRKEIFRNNLYKIDMLNKAERGTAKYGITHLTDLSPSELKLRMGYKPSVGLEENKDQTPFEKVWKELLKEEGKTLEELEKSLPKEFDWRKNGGVVSEVKNQGSNCGSCWAFATTGNIEGQINLRHNISVSLSEQELVDCDDNDSGCNGGLPQKAFSSVIKLGGLEIEKDYPYEGFHDKCRKQVKKDRYNIDAWTVLPSNNETVMKIWLTKRGPLAIGMNADALADYIGGVTHLPASGCPNQADDLNHAVLVVGYGVTQDALTGAEVPYWIIKNSWGTVWGEKGYFRVYRGDNTCGVALFPMTSLVK